MPVAGLFDRYEEALAALTDREERLRSLLRSRADLDWLYEGLCTTACGDWEEFCERLFYQSVNQDSSQLAQTIGINLARRLPLAYIEALFITRGFLDWRSINDLKGLGRKYIVPEHNPFRLLSRADGDAIDDLYLIRNHLLHRSRPSAKGFRRVAEACGYQRPPSPGGLLRQQVDGQSRLSQYLGHLRSAARTMRAAVENQPEQG